MKNKLIISIFFFTTLWYSSNCQEPELYNSLSDLVWEGSTTEKNYYDREDSSTDKFLIYILNKSLYLNRIEKILIKDTLKNDSIFWSKLLNIDLSSCNSESINLNISTFFWRDLKFKRYKRKYFRKIQKKNYKYHSKANFLATKMYGNIKPSKYNGGVSTLMSEPHTWFFLNFKRKKQKSVVSLSKLYEIEENIFIFFAIYDKFDRHSLNRIFIVSKVEEQYKFINLLNYD